MAKILLIGGPLDGQSRDVCGSLLTRPTIQFPELMAMPRDFVVDVTEPEPITVRAHHYHVHSFEVRDRYATQGTGKLYFGWHHDLNGPLEAMVLLMQAYEKEQSP